MTGQGMSRSNGEDSSEDKPEKEAEQKFYRPGGFDGEDK